MSTELVQWHGDTAPLGAAVACLRRGGLLVYPTETVYGIGTALSARDAGIERLRRAKDSPAGRPYLLLVADAAQAFSLWSQVPPAARALAQRHWPGALTMIGPAAPGLPAELLGMAQTDAGPADTLSVRVPGDERIRDLITRLGEPILSTSANRRGVTPPAAFRDVDLGTLAPDLAIDAGTCAGGQPSTLVSLMGKSPRVLRQGGLRLEAAT
jgi:L-threonylcarbamoyladenylate synthase